MVELELIKCLADDCICGESPIWDSHRSLFWWCDIQGRRILSADLAGNITEDRLFDEEVCAIDLLDADVLIVAFRSSVELLHLPDYRRVKIASVEFSSPSQRFNDGKLGPDGAFWVGSIDTEHYQKSTSSLFRVSLSGEVTKQIDKLAISNGLAWSTHGDQLVHADTYTGEITVWQFDKSTGNICSPKLLAVVEKEEGRPDGGILTDRGFYVSAGVSAGRINVFDQTGTLVSSFETDVSAPTSLCLAGDDFDHLVVTSLQRKEKMSPNDGCTSIYRIANFDSI